MHKKISTKRKIIGGMGITTGLLTATGGLTVIAIAAAPMTVGLSLLMAGGIAFGTGVSLAGAGGIAVTNFSKKNNGNELLTTHPIPELKESLAISPSYVNEANHSPNLTKATAIKKPLVTKL